MPTCRFGLNQTLCATNPPTGRNKGSGGHEYNYLHFMKIIDLFLSDDWKQKKHYQQKPQKPNPEAGGCKVNLKGCRWLMSYGRRRRRKTRAFCYANVYLFFRLSLCLLRCEILDNLPFWGLKYFFKWNHMKSLKNLTTRSPRREYSFFFLRFTHIFLIGNLKL